MKIMNMKVRFDKNCHPNRLMIINPQFTQAVDILSGAVYEFRSGKWKPKREATRK